MKFLLNQLDFLLTNLEKKISSKKNKLEMHKIETEYKPALTNKLKCGYLKTSVHKTNLWTVQPNGLGKREETKILRTLGYISIYSEISKRVRLIIINYFI